METDEKRPEIVTDDMLRFLDGIRESGITNMFGASSYIEERFGMGHENAVEVLSYWMESFGKKNR